MLPLGQPRSILREAKQGTSVALSFLVKEREVMITRRTGLQGWFVSSSLWN